jgi:hypothetical protein
MNPYVPLLEAYRRVSRCSRCPICDKPDWCLVARDGSKALCQRVESSIRFGEAGWLHRLCDDRPRRFRRVRTIRSAAVTDFAAMARQCHQALLPGRLDALATDLGLTPTSLSRLGAGWSAAHGAWSFPMSDMAGRVRGIRLRLVNGRKLAVTGSREGLFLPEKCSGNQLLVTEGPTDTAALLDMGFPFVAGRPSCTGGIGLLVELVAARRATDVTIIADADEPGRRGAANLASVLAVYAPNVRAIEPPAGVKDARDWLRAGGSRIDVEERIASAATLRFGVQSRRADRGQ